MTSSVTTALEEMTINNEQLRRENDVLKTDNTRLRKNDDAMKDEIKQLKTNNDKQRDQNKQLRTEIDVMKAENIQLKIENDDLRRHTGTSKLQPLPRARQQPKVSEDQGSHELFTYIIPITHTLITQ